MKPRMRARLGAPLALLLLSGCGFQPLYGSGADSPTADLPSIYVNNILGRFGQQMREDLQQRLDVGNSGADSPYQLDVVEGVSAEGIGIQPDNSGTYSRDIGTTTWTLKTTDAFPRTLATGSARTVDGNNNIDQQYFQDEESGDATQTRIAGNLADEVTLQLAAWFRREHSEGDPHLHPKPPKPLPGAKPGAAAVAPPVPAPTVMRQGTAAPDAIPGSALPVMTPSETDTGPTGTATASGSGTP